MTKIPISGAPIRVGVFRKCGRVVYLANRIDVSERGYLGGLKPGNPDYHGLTRGNQPGAGVKIVADEIRGLIWILRKE